MIDRQIHKVELIEASLDDVWEAWTTDEGATTFFAPQANIDLKIGGSYEILFNPDAPEGERGAEGLKILSFLPHEMLSFEWNAPPQFPEIRKEKTWVVVQMDPVGEDKTLVGITHLGWCPGDDWEQVYQYFVRAWDIVLGRLEHRFASGPIDWNNPFTPKAD
ncbi:SRPBCC domain-containing protein [Candidatus Eisenbacteria bacterium]|uniref:SRPBCC domain-containing protein n=1 Tax=Eiseniibacteriota bacterium TaxID=2212470 RepID=A0ABV6YJG9_UNCEI